MVTYMPSAWPRSTTLVSPATTDTPAAAAAAAMASTSAWRSPAASPSSRTSARVRATGRAPATARSFTVPFTARSPIEPPGKRSGVTTKLSVVIASSTPPTDRSAESPSAAGSGAPRAGTSIPSISVWLARPPAPWAMVMRGSRNLARLARATSMRSRTTCSRSETAVRSAIRQTTSRSRAKRP